MSQDSRRAAVQRPAPTASSSCFCRRVGLQPCSIALPASRKRPVRAAETASMGDFSEESASPANQPPQRPEGMDYRPFPRLNERDVYKRLGVATSATFEEVVDARNYLNEQYKWHEPSREAIELAFDQIIQVRHAACRSLLENGALSASSWYPKAMATIYLLRCYLCARCWLQQSSHSGAFRHVLAAQPWCYYAL